MKILPIILTVIQISILITARYKDTPEIHLLGIILNVIILFVYVVRLVTKKKVFFYIKDYLFLTLLVGILFFVQLYSTLLIGQIHLVIYLIYCMILLVTSSSKTSR